MVQTSKAISLCSGRTAFLFAHSHDDVGEVMELAVTILRLPAAHPGVRLQLVTSEGVVLETLRELTSGQLHPLTMVIVQL